MPFDGTPTLEDQHAAPSDVRDEEGKAPADERDEVREAAHEDG